MGRRLVLIFGLVLFLASISFTPRVQKAEASDTIYIRADGSIEGTDKITSADSLTYMVTDNINDSIYIQRSNIILDGAGFNLTGPGSAGVSFTDTQNVTIRNMNIIGFSQGIYLDNSSHCSIVRNAIENATNAVYIPLDSNFNNVSENSIVSFGNGIYLRESANCTVLGNNITCERADNKFGIYLYYSSGNTIGGNNITQCQACIYFYYSSHNIAYGNTLTNSGWDQYGGGVWSDRSHFNNIHGNHVSGSRWYGIELDSSSNNSISGNEVTSNQNRGIMVHSYSEYNNITGNSVTQNFKGIELASSSHNTIVSGNSLSANTYEAIVVDYSWNNTISGNTIGDASTGILIGGSADHNNITHNMIVDGGTAINLNQGSHNNLYGNNLTGNSFGLTIQSSTGNTIRETVMINNTRSFSLLGHDLPHFINDVDASNTVEYKPIYYWVDAHHTSVPEDAACVILVECSNITIQNTNLSVCNRQGVTIAYSRNITVADNFIADNNYAIWLRNASECYIAGNYLKGFMALQLDYSSNNTFYGNTMTAGGNWGSVNLMQSSNNTFYRNNFTDNYIDYLIDDFSANNWDGGYSLGGNFWDNYPDRYPYATDENSGPHQNVTGSDGIWDIPYTLNEDNVDHYPIVSEFPAFLLLPLFMIVTLVAVTVSRKKRLRSA